MATFAHALYCFESLAADLEKREGLGLVQVQDWWDRYNTRGGNGDDNDYEDDEENLDELEARPRQPQKQEDPALDDDEDDDEDDSDSNEGQLDPLPLISSRQSRTSNHNDLRLPSISRLQQSPSSSSSASSSSTPSSLSTTSSRADVSSSPAASKSSSKSSFFSFGGGQRSPPSTANSKMDRQEHPLFVTWNTVSERTGNKSLRGCIGTFDAVNLGSGLKSYALTAAYDDTRFPPIDSPELSHLSVSVTLLTAFTPCSTPLDWTLGTHGLRISFTHHAKRYSATYLPDVALEQGWTKQETLTSLMRKAGYSSGRGVEIWKKVGDFRVVRYMGAKESCGWEEYKGWREWVDQQTKK